MKHLTPIYDPGDNLPILVQELTRELARLNKDASNPRRCAAKRFRAYGLLVEARLELIGFRHGTYRSPQ